MELSLLLGAHLIGDFVLQDEFMQAKSKNSGVCLYHVVYYSLPFTVMLVIGILHPVIWGLVLIQHYFQDRYALHLRWMKCYEQTTPDKWPVGPLCIDQAFHIGFMWVLVIIWTAWKL